MVEPDRSRRVPTGDRRPPHSRLPVPLLAAATALVVVAAAALAVWWTSGTAGRRPSAAASAGSAQPGRAGPAGDGRQGLATGSARPSLSPGSPPPAGATRHYIANLDGAAATAAALGFDLIDTGPGRANIDALPAGQLALVWLGDLGNADCAAPAYSWTQFTAAVDSLTGDPKVFGYFLADEPHPRPCPGATAEIRRRADYIRTHDPAHVSFIVVLDGSNQCNGGYGCEYTALRPAQTHVDLIGLDPYPCNVDNAASGCGYRKIDDAVRRALASGIPAAAIVPVFQTFGQACAGGTGYYRLPGQAELRTMLARWAALVPHPAFDYAYTWGHQDSACPTLSDADGRNGYPDLQSVMRAHNAGR